MLTEAQAWRALGDMIYADQAMFKNFRTPLQLSWLLWAHSMISTSTLSAMWRRQPDNSDLGGLEPLAMLCWLWAELCENDYE